MSKSLKIILSVLALISVGLSLAIFFGWNFSSEKLTQVSKNFPFSAKKTETLTPTPTEKSFLSCVILEEQFCDQGKPIYDINNQLLGLGFKLPVGTKVYSPFKGQVEKNTTFKLNDKAYPSFGIMDISKDDWGMSPERTYFSIVGYFQNEIPDETLQIEGKAQVVELSGMVIDESLGDYNLILNFMKYNLEKNEWSNDVDLLKQFFPNI